MSNSKTDYSIDISRYTGRRKVLAVALKALAFAMPISTIGLTWLFLAALFASRMGPALAWAIIWDKGMPNTS